MLKRFARDERDILEFFKHTRSERATELFNLGHLHVHIHHHLVGVETRERKGKVTSDEVREADEFLQDETLGLEGEALT